MQKQAQRILLAALVIILIAVVSARADAVYCPLVYTPETPHIELSGICEPAVSVAAEVEKIDYSAEKQPSRPFCEDDIVLIAKTLYGEARGCPKEEQMKVVWCILNRVDDPRFPSTIAGVVTQPSQFHGYSSGFPVCDQQYEIAEEVLNLWADEKLGEIVDRNLPREYCFFYGDGVMNHFKTAY